VNFHAAASILNRYSNEIMKIKTIIVFATTALCAVVSKTNASVIQTDTKITGNQYAIAPTTNLLTQGQATLGSLSSPNFSPWGASALSNLNDNSVSGYAMDLSNSSWTLIAALNVSNNTQGYNITEISTISGWAWDYVDQKYSLSYSTVGDSNSYVSLGTFTLNDTSGKTAKSLKIALTDSTGTIASNVANLKFEFQQAGGSYNHQAAYTEIQAFGSPTTVPEPSALALLGLGTVGFIARRRRN